MLLFVFNKRSLSLCSEAFEISSFEVFLVTGNDLLEPEEDIKVWAWFIKRFIFGFSFSLLSLKFETFANLNEFLNKIKEIFNILSLNLLFSKS